MRQLSRRIFIYQFVISLFSIPLLSFLIRTRKAKNQDSIKLIRHATLLLHVGNRKILVDPMLAKKEGMNPVMNSGNDVRFPLVDLPLSDKQLNKLLSNIDAVIVTHTHRDHWDEKAQSLLDKNIQIFCQPFDKESIQEKGFRNVNAIESETTWNDIKIYRTEGRHGLGEIGEKMGDVSGFVIQCDKNSIYIAGDTVWCEEVSQAIEKHHPNSIVLNAGGAKFLNSGYITMPPEDVVSVYNQSPNSKIIAVHMDVVNHCIIKRKDLQLALEKLSLENKVYIPEDGEQINL